MLEWLVRNNQPSAKTTLDEPTRHRSISIARFILELAILHDPAVIYGSRRLPLEAAFSAFALGIMTCGIPYSRASTQVEVHGLLDPKCENVRNLVLAMQN